jgi:hypothetical protein
MMRRAFSNTCFATALSGCLLMNLAHVPEPVMYLALASVATSAILTNLMWLRSMGLVGMGGLSLVYSHLSGQNLAGTFLTIVIAVLVGSAVVLMIFADGSNDKSQKEHV